MLVAPRLAHTMRASNDTQCGPRLTRLPRPDLICGPKTKTAENGRDVGRADPKTPGLNSRPYWPGGVA